jgi:hypothetical protein
MHETAPGFVHKTFERRNCGSMPRDLRTTQVVAVTSLRDDGVTARSYGYQIILLPLWTRSQNRTTVGARITRQRRLTTTALLGLAPVRF